MDRPSNIDNHNSEPRDAAAANEYLTTPDSTGRLFITRVLGGTLLLAAAASIICVYYWRMVGPQAAVIWLSVLLLLLTARLGVVFMSSIQELAERRGIGWTLLYPVGANLIAIWVGVGAGWVVWHVPLEGQLLMWMLLCSLCAVSASALALLRPSFLAAPAMTLIIPVGVMHWTGQAQAMAVSIFAGTLLLGLAYLFISQSALLRGLMTSNRRNAQLARELTESSARLQQEIEERRLAERRATNSERNLRMLVDNLQDLVYRLDLKGNVLQISPSVETLLGRQPDDMVGRNIREFLPDPGLASELQQALADGGGQIRRHQLPILRKDDSVAWLSATASVCNHESGEPATIEGSAQDVSDALLTERALEVVQGRAQVALDSMVDGVMTTDVDGTVEFVNPAAEQLTGWSLAKAAGKPLADILPLVDVSDVDDGDDPVADCLQKGRCIVLSDPLILNHRDTHASSVVRVTMAPMAARDKSPTSGVVVTLHDVTRLHAMAGHTQDRLSRDPLTGLLDRTEFERRVQHAITIANNGEAEHAVLYLDLDQFKVINDTAGHGAGDESLRQMADCLRPSVRDADVLARLGGDEFGILLEHCPIDNALRVAENLREQIKEVRFQWEDKVFELSGSIGLVRIHGTDSDLTDILKAADAACYMAKDRGRDQVYVYRAEDDQSGEVEGQSRWVQRLRTALEEDGFQLFMQPIKPLADKSLRRDGEFLLRFRGEDGSPVTPKEFFPAAERYHLMPKIDRWVLVNAIQLIERKPESLLGYARFCINLSSQTLDDDSFLDFAVEALNASSIESNRICFEISESGAIASLFNMRRLVSGLSVLGCQFALDDFGSGMRSFQFLKQLNVSKLKIHGDFIRDINGDPVNRASVEAIIQIGCQMGIETVAEHVENQRTLKCVEKLGVDYAQGYFIAGPAAIV